MPVGTASWAVDEGGAASAAWRLLVAGTGVRWRRCAGPAGGTKLAYFQTKNIYHSGLRETHTVALTFDDGPKTIRTAVLDALKAKA